MEVGGPYRVRQSMTSHVEHRSYDFADHLMSCLSSPALPVTALTSSTPITPAPMRTSLSGTFFRDSAPVDETIVSSST